MSDNLLEGKAHKGWAELIIVILIKYKHESSNSSRWSWNKDIKKVQLTKAYDRSRETKIIKHNENLFLLRN